MTVDNQINFRFQNSTIILDGKLENMPKISFILNNYLFNIQLTDNIIHYIPSVEN